ncbi:MAG: hypothetical protein Q9183_003231 [Haloplaca sp. 2 TL-2023]
MSYSIAKKIDYNAHLGHGHDYYTFDDPREPVELSEREKVSERLTGAVRNGDLDAVLKVFEELKALKRINPRDLESPFDLAVRRGHLDIVKFFLSKGAKITRDSTARVARDDKSDVLGMFKAFLQAAHLTSPHVLEMPCATQTRVTSFSNGFSPMAPPQKACHQTQERQSAQCKVRRRQNFSSPTARLFEIPVAFTPSSAFPKKTGRSK